MAVAKHQGQTSYCLVLVKTEVDIRQNPSNYQDPYSDLCLTHSLLWFQSSLSSFKAVSEDQNQNSSCRVVPGQFQSSFKAVSEYQNQKSTSRALPEHFQSSFRRSESKEQFLSSFRAVPEQFQSGFRAVLEQQF